MIVSINCPNSSPRIDINVLFDRIHDLFQKLTLDNSTFVVSGDFNIDLLFPTNKTNKFLSLIKNFNSNFWIKVPTRVKSTSATCIDNIITYFNSDSLPISVFPSHISDNSAQTFSFACDEKFFLCRKIKKRPINDINIEYFLTALEWEEWNAFMDWRMVLELLRDLFLTR